MSPSRPKVVLIGRGSDRQLCRDAILSTGARCRVFDADTEVPTIAPDDGFAGVVLLRLTERERRRALDALRGLGDVRPRVVMISELSKIPAEDDPTVDLLLSTPVNPADVLVACGFWSLRPPHVVTVTAREMVGVTTLGQNRKPVESAIRCLMRSFGAQACAVAGSGGKAWLGGDARHASDEAKRKLLRRAQLAVAAPAPLAMTAVLRDEGTRVLETYVGAPLFGDGRGGVCLVFDGAVRLDDEERALFASVTGRLALELSQRSLARRLVSDLEATRSSGGMNSRLGVWSRAALEPLYELVAANQQRAGVPLAVAIADVRGMSAINDQHGHDVGDAVLRHVAQVSRTMVRNQDVVAHFGGDDIAIVMPGATAAEGAQVMRRLRAKLSRTPFKLREHVLVTIDIAAGVVEHRADESPESLFAKAQRATDDARDTPDDPVQVRALAVASGGSLEDENHRLDGVILGGCYRLRHMISSGGVGVVYRADDLALRRPVAVKLLRPDLATDRQLIERFRDEAAILASLRHPNVVQVYSAGVDDAQMYFAMELIEGRSLDEAIAEARRTQTPIPHESAVDAITQVASALDTLHGRGVLHRDVKPANVLMDPFRDRAVLVDVGLARRRGDAADVSGTPGYMAPEVLQSGAYSPATDVYGLAATAYELIALHQPWPSVTDPLELIRLQSETSPAPASRVRPELGSAVDEVLLRGLRRDPRERFSSAGEFASALAAALRGAAAEATASDARDAGDGAVQAPLAAGASGAWLSEASDADRAIGDEDVAHQTRGAVLRVAARVVGPRHISAWRARLATVDARLAKLVSPGSPPQPWVPTELLVKMIEVEPPGGRSSRQFARELGRAAVRATFRRYFPASSATLVPTGTLSVLPTIWSRYHSWGRIEVSPGIDGDARLRVSGSPKNEGICAWVEGMVEQLITLSGGSKVRVRPRTCECRGGDACEFELSWVARGSTSKTMAVGSSRPAPSPVAHTIMGAPQPPMPADVGTKAHQSPDSQIQRSSSGKRSKPFPFDK